MSIALINSTGTLLITIEGGGVVALRDKPIKINRIRFNLCESDYKFPLYLGPQI
jgi:hypothetical protein